MPSSMRGRVIGRVDQAPIKREWMVFVVVGQIGGGFYT